MKCKEYKSEAENNIKVSRWQAFESKFQDIYGRKPSESYDYVFNVMDFARVSITFAKPKELLKTIEMIKKSLNVVCIKNGYSRRSSAKGSGYRDIKIIVGFALQDDFDGYTTKSGESTCFLCELQLLCNEWLQNKKETSLSYK